MLATYSGSTWKNGQLRAGVETGLTKTEIGKIIIAATFVTDFGTALGLSLLFISPNINSLWFAVISIGIIAVTPRIAPHLFRRYGERVIEPEIKLIFLIPLRQTTASGGETRKGSAVPALSG